MANGSSLNRAKYSGLDFDTHNDDLLARIQVKFAADFNDFAVSSLGIMLLDLTSFGLDTLSFYLDRRASDTYLSTAFTRKSVSRGTRQVGYKMGGAIAASTDLDVSVTEAKPFNVPIPEGFRFEGPNGLIFEAAREVIFTPAEQTAGTVKVVPVFEGETFQEQFVSTGLPSQVFELRRVPENKQVVQGTVTCFVDGSEFDEVDLLEFGSNDQFETGFNDDPPTVRFGDGISGNIPTAGATIDIEYVASRGLAGQVSQGTITDVDTPLVVAFQRIDLNINNPNPAVGGDDLESLSSAKSNAPQVFKSRQVAVVGPDYEGLSGSYSDPLFGRVAVAKAIASRSADSDLTLQNLLQDINNAVAGFDTTIQTETTSITNAVTALNADLSTASAADTEATETDISNSTAVIQNDANSIRTLRTTITVDTADIAQLVIDGRNAVDLLGPDGTVAQGSIRAVPAASLLDGELFILDDGVNVPTTFEFDTVPDGVGVGNVVVDVSAATTAIDVATAMTAAINGVGGTLDLTASNGGGTNLIVSIANDTPGTQGNVFTWSDTVADTEFQITQPSGGSGGTGVLTASEADSITLYFDRINDESDAISGNAQLIETSASSILSQNDGINGYVLVLAETRATKDAALVEANTESGNIQTANNAIIAANTDVVSDISTATTGIFNHVDSLLAADCQANLVTVPILTRDAGGFYTAPSIGLIESLQTFLDARKEVTQTVAVTSGELFLVSADITIRVGVSQGFSEAVVKSAVEVAVDGLLRDREFGAVLYEIDVERVVDDIEGVRFSNVSITGPVTRLDADGNLIPLSSEVITKGTVTINTEAVTS